MDALTTQVKSGTDDVDCQIEDDPDRSKSEERQRQEDDIQKNDEKIAMEADIAKKMMTSPESASVNLVTGSEDDRWTSTDGGQRVGKWLDFNSWPPHRRDETESGRGTTQGVESDEDWGEKRVSEEKRASWSSMMVELRDDAEKDKDDEKW